RVGRGGRLRRGERGRLRRASSMRRNGMRHRAVCAVLLASSVLVADAHAGVFRLRRTVVVGDSLLAGFGSGGLVGVGRPGQVDSAPAFVARRAHVRLPLPFMDAPGVPPPLVIVDANRNGALDMATDTNPGAVTLTPQEFGGRFRTLLEALADTQAGMAVANLPDPTGIAALRRAAGDVTGCRRADGATEPVAADDLLSID